MIRPRIQGGEFLFKKKNHLLEKKNVQVNATEFLVNL